MEVATHMPYTPNIVFRMGWFAGLVLAVLAVLPLLLSGAATSLGSPASSSTTGAASAAAPGPDGPRTLLAPLLAPVLASTAQEHLRGCACWLVHRTSRRRA
jgi:hypothetical protein